MVTAQSTSARHFKYIIVNTRSSQQGQVEGIQGVATTSRARSLVHLQQHMTSSSAGILGHHFHLLCLGHILASLFRHIPFKPDPSSYRNPHDDFQSNKQSHHDKGSPGSCAIPRKMGRRRSKCIIEVDRRGATHALPFACPRVKSLLTSKPMKSRRARQVNREHNSNQGCYESGNGDNSSK